MTLGNRRPCLYLLLEEFRPGPADPFLHFCIKVVSFVIDRFVSDVETLMYVTCELWIHFSLDHSRMTF
jgi:hypothetical protein